MGIFDLQVDRRTFLKIALGSAGAVLFSSCAQPKPLQYWKTLEEELKKATEGSTPEKIIDRGIADVVDMLSKTLWPEYKEGRRVSKLGLLEFSDIDRATVTRLDNYVTEKILTFSFMKRDIAEHFDLIERFLLKNVIHELKFEKGSGYIDPKSAQQLGKVYGINVLASGITTVSPNTIDLNARMVETKRGRVIAVGTSKIIRNPVIDSWLKDYMQIQYKREPQPWN